MAPPPLSTAWSATTPLALSGAPTRGGGGIRGAGTNPPSALVVKYSVIAGNVSHGEGGGLLSFTPPGPAGKLVVINSIVTGNTALGNPACGGGIYVGNSSLDLHGTEIVGNAPGDTCPYP